MILEHQRTAEAEMPALLADVRYGRYAEAIADGNRLIGRGGLTRPQLRDRSACARRGLRCGRCHGGHRDLVRRLEVERPERHTRSGSRVPEDPRSVQ